MAAFNDSKQQFDEIGASILAASVDPLDKAREVQEELAFPVAYGVTRDQADTLGSWWEDRRSIIQPSEFVLSQDGTVLSATYSSGPIGRVMPEDALRLIGFIESQKNQQ